MTNDANKISHEILALRLGGQIVEIMWAMQNHNGGDWGLVHDEIVKLREQCELLLSLDYLGSEPQPLTPNCLMHVARNFVVEGSCIATDLNNGKLDDATARVEMMRDELNKLNLPKAASQPLTEEDIREFVRDFESVLTDIIADLGSGKTGWAIQRMVNLRDGLNQANLPKASV